MFDIDQHRGNLRLGEQIATRVIGFVAVPFEPGGEQIVFDRHTPQDLAVGFEKLLGGFGHGENFADFQPTSAADYHTRISRIARGVDGNKAAHVAEQTVTDEVISHGLILAVCAAYAKLALDSTGIGTMPAIGPGLVKSRELLILG